MSQNLMTQARPLPGLTKLYLLQLYPLALLMLCARFAFAAAGLEGSFEATIWSVIFFCSGAAGVAVIAGVHSRAEWAPRFTAAFNLGLCLLLAAGFARVLAAISGMSGRYYGFGGSEILLPMATAALVMYIPMFLAWRRYFAGSRKLLGAFGIPPQNGGALPPVGLGILRTLAASFLLFYLAFFLTLAVTGGIKDSPGSTLILLALSLPPAVFFIALLGLSHSPGKKRTPLLIALTALAAFMLLWGYAPSFIMALMQNDGMNYKFYSTLQTFRALPMAPLVMGFLAALLAWKIWADPEEQVWFADGQSAGRTPAAFSIYNTVLLYYAATRELAWINRLAYIVRDDNPEGAVTVYILVILFFLLVLLNCAALYNRAAKGLATKGLAKGLAMKGWAKGWNDKTLSLASFAASGALSLVMIGLVLADTFSGEKLRHIVPFLSYQLPALLCPIAVSIAALLHWRSTYAPAGSESPKIRGFFALKGPRLAFALFCIVLMTAMLSKKAIDLSMMMFLPEDDYLRREGIGMASSLLNFEFWASYLLCPLLALKRLCGGLTERRSFYVLGILWVCAIVASLINTLIGMTGRGDFYSLSYPMTTLMDPMRQIHICAIILFMVYLASTAEKAPD